MADSKKEPTTSRTPPAGSPRSRRPLQLGPKGEQRPPLTTRGWLAAAAIHLVLGAILIRVVTFGHGIGGLFDFGRNDVVEERVTYVEPKAPTPPPPTPRPVVRETPTRQRPQESTGPVVAPPGVPAVPTPVRTAPDTGGSGGGVSTAPAVGAIRPELRGVQPGYTDPRLWSAAVPGLATQRNGADRLDSIISYAIITAADSVDAIARANGEGGRRPGDWTTRDKNGDKWGWDEGGIRLGKITIPNALLGLLPMNVQMAMSGNPTTIDRERRLALARRDIMANAQRSVGEAEFKKLVKELRERKDREYQERQKAKDKPIGNN